jgi:hypothetical protein
MLFNPPFSEGKIDPQAFNWQGMGQFIAELPWDIPLSTATGPILGKWLAILSIITIVIYRP